MIKELKIRQKLCCFIYTFLSRKFSQNRVNSLQIFGSRNLHTITVVKSLGFINAFKRGGVANVFMLLQ